jgi:hypothetical protein
VRWLAGLFLVAHGVLHLVIWIIPTPADAPFDAHHSPMLGNVRVVSMVLAVLCGIVLVAAGVGVLAQWSWWPQAAIIGAAGSIALLLFTFTPWWLLALAIDIAIVVLSGSSYLRWGGV